MKCEICRASLAVDSRDGGPEGDASFPLCRGCARSIGIDLQSMEYLLRLDERDGSAGSSSPPRRMPTRVGA